MEDMKKYIPGADMDKLKIVVETQLAYKDGKLSKEEAMAILKEKVKRLTVEEVALAEQQLTEFREDECEKEKIQEMMELYDEIMVTEKPELKDNHPIARYYQENEAMKKILLEIEDLVQYPVIKNQWLDIYERMGEFRIHLSRKQNQLYPVLERKGFDRPTTTMWKLDDFIRDEIRDVKKLLDEGKEDEFIAMQKTVVDDVRDLMDKEEVVLYPTSLKMISEEEFEDMKLGDREIGFAWIGDKVSADEPKAQSASKTAKPVSDASFANELANLLGKYGFAGKSEDEVHDVAMGKLTLEQINLIFKHLPVDLSYVDENEIVKFYSDTKHRVFPRSKNVIGRDVKNCHPRTSVHIVEEIIEKFRSGEKDNVEFWINKPGVFIYIYYVAVRDEEGRFRGVLEMMQECTHIRGLEGSRTLLTWDKGSEKESTEELPVEEELADENREVKSGEKLSINPDTKLSDILDRYPEIRKQLPEISPKFNMINSPLGRIMAKQAKVKDMSERGDVPMDKLISELNERISKLQ